MEGADLWARAGGRLFFPGLNKGIGCARRTGGRCGEESWSTNAILCGLQVRRLLGMEGCRVPGADSRGPVRGGMRKRV